MVFRTASYHSEAHATTNRSNIVEALGKTAIDEPVSATMATFGANYLSVSFGNVLCRYFFAVRIQIAPTFPVACATKDRGQVAQSPQRFQLRIDKKKPSGASPKAGPVLGDSTW